MSYVIIDLPVGLRLSSMAEQFAEMTKKELLEYAKWIQAVIPERRELLTRCVKATATFEDWPSDLSPGSLSGLGRWFEGQVQTRKRSGEELRRIRDSVEYEIEVSENELTDRTFSIAFDVALYLASVVLQNVPGTHWGQVFGSRNNVFFGHVVVLGLGKVPYSPVHNMIVAARCILDGRSAKLLEAYERLKGRAS